MLLERGFIRTIADVTLENIVDCKFCQKSSSLMFNTLLSFKNVFHYENFFLQIKEFELVCALILKYSSDKGIIIDTLRVMKIVIGSSCFIEFTKKNLKPLFEPRLLNVLVSLMKNSKDVNIKSFCFHILSVIRDKCKAVYY